MTNRRILMFFVSSAVGALLILILVRLARVDLGTAVNQLRAAKGFAVAKLLLLNTNRQITRKEVKTLKPVPFFIKLFILIYF